MLNKILKEEMTNLLLLLTYHILVQCHISIPPEKRHKTYGFLTFLGGIEM